eukprot:scaffold27816_cov17-Prasinocladus_malaysianus.AAC.1
MIAPCIWPVWSPFLCWGFIFACLFLALAAWMVRAASRCQRTHCNNIAKLVYSHGTVWGITADTSTESPWYGCRPGGAAAAACARMTVGLQRTRTSSRHSY